MDLDECLILEQLAIILVSVQFFILAVEFYQLFAFLADEKVVALLCAP